MGQITVSEKPDRFRGLTGFDEVEFPNRIYCNVICSAIEQKYLEDADQVLERFQAIKTSAVIQHIIERAGHGK